MLTSSTSKFYCLSKGGNVISQSWPIFSIPNLQESITLPVSRQPIWYKFKICPSNCLSRKVAFFGVIHSLLCKAGQNKHLFPFCSFSNKLKQTVQLWHTTHRAHYQSQKKTTLWFLCENQFDSQSLTDAFAKFIHLFTTYQLTFLSKVRLQHVQSMLVKAPHYCFR